VAAARRVQVVLDRVAAGLDRPFDYRVPAHLQGLEPGWRVRVPLGTSHATGMVVAMAEGEYAGETLREVEEPYGGEALLPPDVVQLVPYLRDRWCCWWGQAVRAVVPAPVRLSPPPDRPNLYAVGDAPRGPARARLYAYLAAHPGATEREARDATGASRAMVRALLAAGAIVRGPAPRSEPAAPAHALSVEQRAAADRIGAYIESGRTATVLLEGVTGSGKTEVYLEAAAAAIRSGRQAIVLVPEIALTPQMGARFRERFPGRVAVFHSAMADGDRVAEWYRVRRGDADVVLGPRSAVFAPCPRLGLVVVDEEHEATYKQEEHPRYHAREVAAERARRAGAVLVLGSATPSLEAAHRARTGEIEWVRLTRRVAGRPLAQVSVVDMRAELEAGNREMFSRLLDDLMTQTLAAGDQAILLMNRRGFAKSLVCRSCGHTVHCPSCSVSLTWHRQEERLVCHYCDFRARVPTSCPACGSARMRSFGVGTEKVVEAARARWPHARIERADRDSLRQRGSYDRLFRAFAEHRVDMLVGTQLLAKGMDWPGVTLVGVVAADLALSLPDFRAAERTYDLLTQAAGRAGRGDKAGRVVVQTYNPDHYSVRAAAAQSFEPFYDEEISYRAPLGYPPFGHLLLVEAGGPTEEAARAAAARAAGMLSALPGLTLRGPAPAPVETVREQHRWHLLVKAADLDPVLKAARTLADGLPALSLTVDPHSFL
jgi:primosomal protein N' (replication factor Y)